MLSSGPVRFQAISGECNPIANEDVGARLRYSSAFRTAKTCN